MPGLKQYVLHGSMLTLGFASLLGLSACNKQVESPSASVGQSSGAVAQTTPTAPLQIIAEDTVPVKTGEISQRTPFTGTVQAASQTTVQSQTSGTVQAVYGDIGQPVRKGQLLVRLNSPDNQARLAQAQSSLASAKAQARLTQSLVERKKRLLQQGYISRVEYEQAQVEATAQQENVRAQQANVDIARKASQDSQVISPMSGIINKRLVEVGQTLAPGQTVYEIVDIGQLEIRAVVPLSGTNLPAVGQLIEVRVQGSDVPVPARITRIAPMADTASRTLIFFAKPTGQVRLSIGAYVEGDLVTSNNIQGQLIPLGSVQKTGTQSMVWVIRDSTLRKIPVQVQQTDPQNDLALVTGLQATDRVSRINFAATDDGRPVQLSSPTQPAQTGVKPAT